MYCNMSDTIIDIRNISKVYRLYDRNIDRLKEAVHPFKKKYHRPFHALKNVSLKIRKGEILGIVGRNGAGKSTLLKIVTGIITQSVGQCSVKGRISPLLTLGAGFNPELTGMENVYLNGMINGFSRKQMDEKIHDILSFAEIGDYIHQPVRTYSSGMTSRVGFALAIHIDPEILILDEVLSVGDELFKRKCYAKMEELFDSGCTVLFVSHSPGDVNNICSRAILLNKGELILDAPPLLVTRYYHKYLYTSPESQDEIIKEIRKLNKDEKRKKDFIERSDEDKGDQKNPMETKKKEVTPAQKDRKFKPEAYLIPDFRPKSAVIQKFHDVEISGTRIETLSGNEVNALVINETYIFSYKVKFNLDVANVRFSTLFQNEKGLAVTGVKIPDENSSEKVKIQKNDTYLVKIKFKNLLLPDNYYINIAVLQITEQKEKIPLIRLNDAAVFKTQDEKGLPYWGVVNLEQAGEIIKIT